MTERVISYKECRRFCQLLNTLDPMEMVYENISIFKFIVNMNSFNF